MKTKIAAVMIFMFAIIGCTLTGVFAEEETVTDSSLQSEDLVLEEGEVQSGNFILGFTIEEDHAVLSSYRIPKGTYTTDDCETLFKEMVIPDTYEGLPVTKITDSITQPTLYINRKTVEIVSYVQTVTLPNQLKEIGRAAFKSFGIKEISFPETLKVIGMESFKNTPIQHVILPEGLERLDNGCFENCTQLESIIIPEGITTVPNAAFSGCTSLESVLLPSGLTSIEGSAFTNAPIDEIEIPEGVTLIGAGAFSGTNLSDVKLPENLKNIQNYSFSGTNLSEIDIPDGVTEVGFCAFSGTKIKSLILPESLKQLEWIGLYDLEELYIPDTITAIGWRAFYGLPMNDFVIPDTVTYIAYDAFELETGGYISKDRPMREQTLRLHASSDSYLAQFIEQYPGYSAGVVLIPTDTDEQDGIYYKQNDTGITILGALDTVSEVPTEIAGLAVTEIGPSAFAGNKQIRSMESDCLVKIGERAFADSALNSVSVSSKTEIGMKSFFNNTNLTSVTLNTVTLTSQSLAYTTSLEKLALKSTKTVEANALQKSGIRSLSFPKSLTTLKTNAMSETTLDSLILPSGAVNLEKQCFGIETVIHNLVIPTLTESSSINLCGSQTRLENITYRENTQDAFLPKLNLYPTGSQDQILGSFDIYIPGNVTEISEDRFGTVRTEWSYDPETGEEILVPDFTYLVNNITIHGVEGSVAESFALEHHIAFVADYEPYSDIGDVTRNGKIDSTDALQVLRSAVKEIELSEKEQSLADVNGDSTINSSDALQILRYAVKEIEVFV